MGVWGFLISRFVTGTVVFLALTIGWLCQAELPMGRFFATVIPLMKGIMPPTVVGHGKMKGTPPVPDDMEIHGRPAAERFLTLPGTGDLMPANGLGLCCRPTAYDDVLVRRSVLWYLLLGGRHLDGAHLYLNHEAVGLGIHDAVARGIDRKDIFVTTKLFCTHFGYNTTLETVPKFLDEMGLEYIDLVLMHSPSAFPFITSNECTKRGVDARTCRQETWKALSELRAKGLIRNVGVSNFGPRHLQDIEDLQLEDGSNIAPITNNQIQYSPFAPKHIQDTVEYCRDHNITVTAYSPLGGLTHRDLAEATKALQVIAERYQVTVAQVMLRWVVQKNMAVIPGTGNPKHMEENLAIYDFELSDADMQAIHNLQFEDQAEKFFFLNISSLP